MLASMKVFVHWTGSFTFTHSPTISGIDYICFTLLFHYILH